MNEGRSMKMSCDVVMMNIMIAIKCLLVLLALLLLGKAVKNSALRMAGDSSTNDIIISYVPDYKKYLLTFQTTFQYVEEQTPFTFCFRRRPVTLAQDGTCDLTNTTGSYDCLGIQIYSNNTGTFSKWTLTYDLTTKSEVKQITPNQKLMGSTLETVSISLDGQQDGQNFSFVGQSNTIFEVMSGRSFDLYNSLDTVKINFMNTFVQSFSAPSDNLLMQRQTLCYMQGDIVNLLFLGAVQRETRETYLAAFIHYHSKSTKFLLWAGLAFSKDKASRDMLGIFPSTAQADDLFSLYATAPFTDTSINVNGTDDWVVEASSDHIQSGEAGWFYYTQLSRQFDTNDKMGDEVIQFKINNQYCLAAYFTYDTTAKFLYNQKDYPHTFLRCFTPDLALTALPVSLSFLLLLLLPLLS